MKRLKSIEEIKIVKDLELYIVNKKLNKTLMNKLLTRNTEDSNEFKKIINDYDVCSLSTEKFKSEYNLLIKYEFYETLFFNISKNNFHDIYCINFSM